MSTQIMNQLKAENLLEGSFVLTQVESLKNNLQYKTDDKFVAYDDHFRFLQNGIDDIPRIKLLDSIPATLGSKYENELLTALEEIQDLVEKWTVKVIRFQGDAMRAKSDVEELRAAFESWYHLAALDVLSAAEIKLPATNVKNLASSEFNRLMDRSNISLDALIEALKIEVKRLESRRKMAREKFEMGREQVNASWANQLPNALGISPNAPSLGVLTANTYDDVEEGETVPYVSVTGEVKSSEPAPESNVVVMQTPAPANTVLVEQIKADLTAAGATEATSCPDCNKGWTDCSCEEEQAVAEHAAIPELEVVVEVPSVIVTKEKIAGDAVIEEPVIKGTFKKTGDAAPVTVVSDPEAPKTPANDYDDEVEEPGTGYHVELDPEASAPEYDDIDEPLLVLQAEITVDQMADAFTQVLNHSLGTPAIVEEQQPEVSNFVVTEVSLIDEKNVVTPGAAVIHSSTPAPRKTMDFDDDEFDDFSAHEQRESAPTPVPVVEPVVAVKEPEPTPPPVPAVQPVSTRTPMNFEFDDDDF